MAVRGLVGALWMISARGMCRASDRPRSADGASADLVEQAPSGQRLRGRSGLRAQHGQVELFQGHPDSTDTGRWAKPHKA